MLEKKCKMRSAFTLPRRFYFKFLWKILFYLACGVLVVKVIKDITEIGENSWPKNKWNLRYREKESNKIKVDKRFIPGKFLESAHPARNHSYCNERWSILNSFSNATGSPELGRNGPYRIIYDVIGSRVVNVRKFRKDSDVGCVGTEGVTYVTHATPEYLYHIAELLRLWEGPISVAVFAPGSDSGLAHFILTRLCHCLLPQQAHRLSVQIVFHVDHPPALPRKDFKKITFREGSECGPPSVLGRSTYRTKMSLPYPVNVARNAARAGARTPHIFVSDVELLPSKGLASQFCSMLGRANRKQGVIGVSKNWKANFKIPIKIPLPQPAVSGSEGVRRLAFVVPVFEVELGEKVPETKEQLLALMATDRAFYFHRWQCIHCQKFPGIHLWLEEKRSVPGNLQPLVMVRREFPYHRWEPIYIGTNREPLYSEVLMWEGRQDKMTQMHQMCLLGYRFVILDRAFLVHTPGVKRPLLPQSARRLPIKEELNVETQQQNEWLRSHEKRNTHLYELIVESMNLAHPRNPKCKIH